MKKIDYKISRFMQDKLANPVLDRIMSGFTFLGDYCLIWLVITAFFYVTSYKKLAMFMILSMLVTNAVNNGLIKSLFRRKRPFEEYEDIHIFIPSPYGSSFPSGHSATGFGCALIVAQVDPMYGLIAYVIAGLIAFSRLYLCVHYASDILVGSLVGVISTYYLLVYFW